MGDIRRLSDRAVISVIGDGATTFLQGLVTNGPPEEAGVFSALLTPQGKILFDFFIHKHDTGYWIDVDQNAAPALLKRLTLYKLRAKVDIHLVEDFGVFIAPDDAFSAELADGRIVAQLTAFPDADPFDEFNKHRIADGVPQWGADFGSDELFLMDVNYDALAGVDYKKGCFVGQEVASRMKRKGEARKRTLIATFDGPAPVRGAAIIAGQSTLGHVMSGVDGIALALIRVDRWTSALENQSSPECEGRSLSLALPGYLQQG